MLPGIAAAATAGRGDPDRVRAAAAWRDAAVPRAA
jgi:hypothetical protein